MRANKVLAVLLGLFFAVGLFVCTNLTALSSAHDLEAVSSVCPPSSHDGSCSNVQEHLSFWQTLLSATPTYFNFLLGALLLALLIPRARALLSRTQATLHLIEKISHKNRTPIFFRHSLQEAFSSGILHSKAF